MIFDEPPRIIKRYEIGKANILAADAVNTVTFENIDSAKWDYIEFEYLLGIPQDATLRYLIFRFNGDTGSYYISDQCIGGYSSGDFSEHTGHTSTNTSTRLSRLTGSSGTTKASGYGVIYPNSFNTRYNYYSISNVMTGSSVHITEVIGGYYIPGGDGSLTSIAFQDSYSPSGLMRGKIRLYGVIARS